MKLTLSFLLLLPTLTSAFFQFARSDDGGLIFNNATLGERSFERQSSRRRKIPGLTVYRNRNTEKEDCKTYRIYYNMDEYQRKLDFVKPARNGPEIGATGESIRSFDVRTGRLVGDASFSVVFVGEFDCVVSTVLSFEKEFGIARSQLFLQASCSTGGGDAIVGGTGVFECATGTAFLYRSSPKRNFVELIVCESCE